MVSRRQVLVAGAAGGAAVLVPAGSTAAGRALAASTMLRAADIPKYVAPLPIPPAMPRVANDPERDTYVVGVRQFRQQILPPSWPRTTVWGYGSSAHPGSFGYPAPSIVTRVNRPVRVTWVNELVDDRGDYLPHLLPIDPTLHWANPAGGRENRDGHGRSDGSRRGYRGPVPQVVHLHGGHSTQESDGHAEAWYLPVARDLPADFAVTGSAYGEFRSRFAEGSGLRWAPGSATFEYANDQRPCTLWYHDHTLGLTRENVYAGPAGFYLLGGDDLPDGVLPGPTPGHDDPPDTDYHDIPLLIQDRSFGADGELVYPGGHHDGSAWVSAFSGTTMVVNGRTWPSLTVQRRRYRFRLLNGCNSRFLMLSVAAHATARPARPVLPIWQIGSDSGFLPEPVSHDRVTLGPAQRADVIVDFTGVPAGTELFLVNEGPEWAYRGGRPGVDFPPSDPRSTGQVLRFVVDEATGADPSVPPEHLQLPPHPRLGAAERVRRLSLNERMSGGSMVMLLGTLDERGRGLPMRWSDPATEQPVVGVTEVWEVRNFTRNVHPVHLHQAQFELLGRGRSGRSEPRPGERGWMDTVLAYPWEVTRIKARFDLPGRFSWHCHLLEHEDNEMMRPLIVLPRGAAAAGDGSSAGVPPAPAAASTDAS
ncbi:multicopper oxidase domain-containing protein [Micromonospora sp. WMMD710]|uniref:multicopper oxidase family protein n=1 Tax=Micromonospora sp. WMMD710 TaxID=3016085 RepID=UPI0024167024|nr:multicopper oxidase domain-containing protein [Micromonospora sp. WMMD710]MDG4758896.1 multicopper oxidase domain-containing protein [Micromonospora sp. WMMD710]